MTERKYIGIVEFAPFQFMILGFKSETGMQVLRTPVITTVFVTKDFAVKSNLLL